MDVAILPAVAALTPQLVMTPLKPSAKPAGSSCKLYSADR